jgi:hypothetical protein
MASYNRPGMPASYYRDIAYSRDDDWETQRRHLLLNNSPKKASVTAPAKKKPERTPLKHLTYAVGTILAVFFSIGGVVGAVVGDVAAWQHLNWLYALYITLGLISVVAGIMIYTSDV